MSVLQARKRRFTGPLASYREGSGQQNLGPGVAGIWGKWQKSGVVHVRSEPKGVTALWQNAGAEVLLPLPIPSA